MQGRFSDLILEDVPCCPTSFLKIQGIALCPWKPLKGDGDPKNNRLYLGGCPQKPASSLPLVPISQ